MNKKAIELAIKTALALNCKIEPHSIFARIHRWHSSWWPCWKAYQRRVRGHKRGGTPYGAVPTPVEHSTPVKEART